MGQFTARPICRDGCWFGFWEVDSVSCQPPPGQEILARGKTRETRCLRVGTTLGPPHRFTWVIGSPFWASGWSHLRCPVLFRKFHSTETATCYFLENVKSLLDQGGFVTAVFLDLKSAFDTINHDVLVAKLTNFNFSNSALCWMKSYLSDRKQQSQQRDRNHQSWWVERDLMWLNTLSTSG